MRHGFPVRYYKKIRERNDALDCFVYNLAALEILNPNFERMAKNLLEWETLESDQIDQIMAGDEPRPPAPSSDDDPSITGSDAESGGAASQKPEINPNIDLPAGHSA